MPGHLQVQWWLIVSQYVFTQLISEKLTWLRRHYSIDVTQLWCHVVIELGYDYCSDITYITLMLRSPHISPYPSHIPCRLTALLIFTGTLPFHVQFYWIICMIDADDIAGDRCNSLYMWLCRTQQYSFIILMSYGCYGVLARLFVQQLLQANNRDHGGWGMRGVLVYHQSTISSYMLKVVRSQISIFQYLMFVWCAINLVFPANPMEWKMGSTLMSKWKWWDDDDIPHGKLKLGF